MPESKMTRDRSALLRDLFAAACRLDGAARAAFLAAECGADAALRGELEELLRLDVNSRFLGEAELSAMRVDLGESAAVLPERIGSFQVLGLLGRGGMGVVYRARQEQPAREVALKVLAPGLADGAGKARFAMEAEALGRLQHPGIAQIHEAGTYRSAAGEQPYLAMELVSGVPLHVWAATRRADLAARLGLLIEICEAVHHAHQKGLIHRDLKPGNVLVDAADHPKVLDFGIARFVAEDPSRTLQTLTGQVLGTLAYMSPEQASGQSSQIDIRTDVYALGVVGYELLAGALPIELTDSSLTGQLQRLATVEPTPLGQHDRRLRGDLQTIFAMALRKEPERRYDTAQALADDLRRYLAHEPIRARPATASYVVRRFARRHRALVAGVSIAVLAMVAGTTASLLWATRAEAAERAAQEEARVANRVVAFVQGLFSAAAPSRARGKELSAREVVEAGRAGLLLELADEPLLRARLAMFLGRSLIELGGHDAAEPLLADAVGVYRRAPVGEERRLLEAIYLHGRSLHLLGRLDEGRRCFETAIAMHTRAGAPRSPDIAMARAYLAVIADEQGELATARAEFAIAAEEMRVRSDPSGEAQVLMLLARSHERQREFDEAERCFLRVAELVSETTDPLLAGIVATNLGNLRAAQRRFDLAEADFRRALELGERDLGKEHPALIRRLCNLAGVFGATGRIAEAEPLLERAVAISTGVDSRHDDGVSTVLLNLANVRTAQTRYREALELFERAAAIHERRTGPGGRALSAVLEKMAVLHEYLGEPERAVELRRRIAAMGGRGN